MIDWLQKIYITQNIQNFPLIMTMYVLKTLGDHTRSKHIWRSFMSSSLQNGKFNFSSLQITE